MGDRAWGVGWGLGLGLLHIRFIESPKNYKFKAPSSEA